MAEPGPAGDANRTQACCSAFYEQDWVRVLAEDSFHPGGAALSRRTVAAMELPAGATLLDVGCGTGTTAALVQREFGLSVIGIDASAANVERAAARAESTGLSFERADAHALPFVDNEFDGVLAECVFSLLADKEAALNEFRRILKPGGRISLTDMAVGSALPADIADVAARWTCLTDALDVNGYCRLFADAGFSVAATTDESAGLSALLTSLKRKLLVAGAGGLLAGGVPLDLAMIRYWLDRVAGEIDRGSIRYLRFQLVA